jgi:hypothetical protein
VQDKEFACLEHRCVFWNGNDLANHHVRERFVKFRGEQSASLQHPNEAGGVVDHIEIDQ